MSSARFNTLTVSIIAFSIILPPRQLPAARYSISKKVIEGHTTYHLRDSSRRMDAGVVPGIGNFVYEFKADGKDVLIPAESLTDYAAKRGFCCGIPFLAPFANRIDGDAYYFEGRKYLLNGSLNNFRRDQFGQPIHGLLDFDSRWEVMKTGASDSTGAFITSRMEFYKYPDLMEQFPFACSIEITYRLKDGRLENITTIHNLSLSNMPVLVGYHPYFRPDGPRQDWVVHLTAQRHWILNGHLIPTGETEPTDKYLPGSANILLGEKALDGVFSQLARDSNGLGHIWTQGKTEKVEVVYGPEYDFAVVYAPRPNDLVCMEMQTGPTSAFNLNHEGKFPGLLTLAPGKTFKASFWIVPTGF